MKSIRISWYPFLSEIIATYLQFIFNILVLYLESFLRFLFREIFRWLCNLYVIIGKISSGCNKKELISIIRSFKPLFSKIACYIRPDAVSLRTFLWNISDIVFAVPNTYPLKIMYMSGMYSLPPKVLPTNESRKALI